MFNLAVNALQITTKPPRTNPIKSLVEMPGYSKLLNKFRNKYFQIKMLYLYDGIMIYKIGQKDGLKRRIEPEKRAWAKKFRPEMLGQKTA